MRDHDQPNEEATDPSRDDTTERDDSTPGPGPKSNAQPGERRTEKLFDPDALVVSGVNNPTPPPVPPSNTGRNLLIGVGGVMVVGLAVGILAFNGSGSRTTPPELSGLTPRPRATMFTGGDLPIEDENTNPLAFTTSTTTTSTSTSTSAPEGGQGATGRDDTAEGDEAVQGPNVGELAADRSERLAVFKGGVVYLRGRVPAQEVADAIAARAAAVVGPDNVVVEYVIDPEAAMPEAAPLYVEDLVLFAYDSTDVGPEFLPLLELGVSLLEQVPTVTVEVRGHTDAAGSDVYNLDLSQRRVDSVVDYWVGRGVDPSRVAGVGYGETDLLDSANPNSPLNRRVEFVISGILG